MNNFNIYYMYRKQGNKLFTKKKYTEAIEKYNLGIENNEDEIHLILSNRALAYYYLEDYTSSLKDCIEICKTNSTWFKGWFRLSQTLEKMGKKDESEKAYLRYKELEEKSKKKELKITEQPSNTSLPALNPEMIKEMMKDDKMMKMADKLMSNDKIRSKLMNNEFKERVMGNSDILKNPMSLMADKNFQEIFSETLKILQEKDKDV